MASAVAQGDLVVVPAGQKHNFVNTGPNPLVLYTVYGPPEHADQAVHRTGKRPRPPRRPARTSHLRPDRASAAVPV